MSAFGSYKHYSTSGTKTVVDTGPGHLLNVVINGGTAGTVTLYDDSAGGTTTARRLAIIETIGANNPVSLPMPLIFNRGLTAVLANATDVTIVYQ